MTLNIQPRIEKDQTGDVYEITLVGSASLGPEVGAWAKQDVEWKYHRRGLDPNTEDLVVMVEKPDPRVGNMDLITITLVPEGKDRPLDPTGSHVLWSGKYRIVEDPSGLRLEPVS